MRNQNPDLLQRMIQLLNQYSTCLNTLQFRLITQEKWPTVPDVAYMNLFL